MVTAIGSKAVKGDRFIRRRDVQGSANIGVEFGDLAPGFAFTYRRQGVPGHGLIPSIPGCYNNLPSSRRLVIVSVGSMPQGSNIDFFDRRTHALLRP